MNIDLDNIFWKKTCFKIPFDAFQHTFCLCLSVSITANEPVWKQYEHLILYADGWVYNLHWRNSGIHMEQ